MIEDPYFDQWTQVVTWGSLMLALGTSLFWVGCLHLARIGHRLVAGVLATSGAFVALGSVGGALYLDVVASNRWTAPPVTVLGMRLGVPDLLLLPDDAVAWGLLGTALAVTGVGLASIRRRARQPV